MLILHKIVAIDLTILAESIPRKWGFILSGLACIWGVGNTVTGLIGKWKIRVHTTDSHLHYRQLGRCW
jgi:hypothetical protein